MSVLPQITSDVLYSYDNNPEVQKADLDEQLYTKLFRKSPLWRTLLGEGTISSPKKFITAGLHRWMRGDRTTSTVEVGTGGLTNDNGVLELPLANQGAKKLRPGFVLRALGKNAAGATNTNDEAFQVLSIWPDNNGVTLATFDGAGAEAGLQRRSYGTTQIGRGGNGVQTHSAGHLLQIMPALPQNSEQGIGVWSKIQWADNITQILGFDLSASDTMLQSQYHGIGSGANWFAVEWKNGMENLTEQLVAVLMHGLRSPMTRTHPGLGGMPTNQAGDSFAFGTMSGVVEMLNHGIGYYDDNGDQITRQSLIDSGHVIKDDKGSGLGTDFTWDLISRIVDKLEDAGVDPGKMILWASRSQLRKAYDWIVGSSTFPTAGNPAAGKLQLTWQDFAMVGAAAPSLIKTKSGTVIRMQEDPSLRTNQLGLMNMTEITPCAQQGRALKVYTLPSSVTGRDGQAQRVVAEWSQETKGVGSSHVYCDDVNA